MAHPLATADELRELLADEDERIGRFMVARPVSPAHAVRITEGLTRAKARKAALLGELAAREAGAA